MEYPDYLSTYGHFRPRNYPNKMTMIKKNCCLPFENSLSIKCMLTFDKSYNQSCQQYADHKNTDYNGPVVDNS